MNIKLKSFGTANSLNKSNWLRISLLDKRCLMKSNGRTNPTYNWICGRVKFCIYHLCIMEASITDRSIKLYREHPFFVIFVFAFLLLEKTWNGLHWRRNLILTGFRAFSSYYMYSWHLLFNRSWILLDVTMVSIFHYLLFIIYFRKKRSHHVRIVLKFFFNWLHPKGESFFTKLSIY